MLNSVGLQNGGVVKFINYELPNLVTKDTRIIANIAGSTIEECAELAEKLNGTAVDMIELNISCPNVKQGGAAFGTDCNVARCGHKGCKGRYGKASYGKAFTERYKHCGHCKVC